MRTDMQWSKSSANQEVVKMQENVDAIAAEEGGRVYQKRRRSSRHRKVTDPFNEQVVRSTLNACHCSSSSSSSSSNGDQQDQNDLDAHYSFPCHEVDDFDTNEEKNKDSAHQKQKEKEDDREEEEETRKKALRGLLSSLMENPTESFLVTEVTDVISGLNLTRQDESPTNRDSNNSAMRTQMPRKPIVKALQEKGFNARLCKSKWERSHNSPAGQYYYIDIIVDQKSSEEGEGEKLQQRYIVEIDFQGHFEVARPTRHYQKLVGMLPTVFVVRAEESLKQIIQIMCESLKESLKSRAMPIPPWRTRTYMTAMWFASFVPIPERILRSHQPIAAKIRVSAWASTLQTTSDFISGHQELGYPRPSNDGACSGQELKRRTKISALSQALEFCVT